jgi:D-glycero-D-manno-heptose 1,7-bisphosphate phosphatase
VADSENSAPPRIVNTIFLDRDGVLNEKMPEGFYVTSWDQFRPLPGAVEAIGRLNRVGLRVVVISNQRGIALGLYTTSDVHAIHAKFQALLETEGAHIDAFYFCPHDKKECDCRKPLPGLFEQAAVDFPDISSSTSAVIGDSLSDIEFGRRLGMLTVYIEGDPELRKPGADAAREMADFCFSSLADAVDGLHASLRSA